MVDITKLFKKYENKWLALTDDDKVISSGKTLDEAVKKARSKGFNSPVTIKVPNSRLELVLHVDVCL